MELEYSNGNLLILKMLLNQSCKFHLLKNLKYIGEKKYLKAVTQLLNICVEMIVNFQ